jgi:RNA polymerase sigma-70 factor (ECF subfamily)
MPQQKSKDDDELVWLVAQRNRDAFIALYDRYAARVYALAMRMCGEQMAAEEVAQDTFVKLWTRADAFSPKKGTFLSWLLTITRRTALDRIRLDNRRPEFNNPVNPENTWRFSPDPNSQGEEARWRSLYFVLQEIPAEQREVIELSFYHGMSQSQIADYLTIPLGTVKTRIRLGMEKLRKMWIVDKSKSA